MPSQNWTKFPHLSRSVSTILPDAPTKALILPRDPPHVTVQLPVYNAIHVIERLVDSACAQDYPRSRFDVQILDDSTDDTSRLAAQLTKAWQKRGGNVRHVRRGTREGYKAGGRADGAGPLLLAAWRVGVALPRHGVTRGWLNDVLGWVGLGPVRAAGTIWIILAAHVFYNVSIVIRLVSGVWANLDPRSEEAARLGCMVRDSLVVDAG